MSTSFNFPANPTLNQIVVLPDGNSAQWNGYAWVSVANNVTYPLAVASGGTGATNPATARVNLGLNAATGEFILDKDGTVALPGLAFKSEPGMGFYRLAANQIALAVQGQRVVFVAASDPKATGLNLNARTPGAASISLINGPSNAVNYNLTTLVQAEAGGAILTTAAGGTAVRGNLFLDTPQVLFNDGTVAAPNIAFASEPGLGWYRGSASEILCASQGSPVSYVNNSVATRYNSGIAPRTAGESRIVLWSAPWSAANSNQLILSQNTNGSALIQTGYLGTATRGNLTLDAPSILTGGNIVVPSGNSVQASYLFAGGAAAEIYVFPAGNYASGAPAWPATNGGLITVRGSTSQNYAAGTISCYSGSGNTGCYLPPAANSWVASSDERLKNIDSEITNGLEAVLAMRPIRYRYKTDPADTPMRVGLTAQSVQPHVPEAVYESPILMGADQRASDEVYLNLSITDLVPHLINAVKTLNQRLTAIGA